ncbi:Ig-like domain-containing protein [Shewanella surugensis]|uniref:Ig-like domain-containing protein n=1 Tax=Shewanella surugensis TaxID=212020 RepID=A0ABT0LF77_9GAMM|nr:Ig-like domain-containing protein [Shewanella surugensis]MCL1126135.1 Ig-like domain-containing protein [Shewanella surugensis]
MKIKIISLAMLVFLSACGGDNSQEEKEVMLLPVIQSDKVDVIDDETVIIDVLSNDSFSSGSLSITGIDIEPLYGSATINKNKITYTPNKGYAGLDTLTYSVNNIAVATEVEISVYQSLTLFGQVIESTLLNADVNVQIGDEVVTSQIDTDGYYELDVKLNSLNDILTIRAKGHETNEQQSIELISHAGEMQTLFNKAGDDRTLSSEELSTLKLSALSTASYLHTIELNNSQALIKGESLTAFLDNISTEALLNTAGFIQLIIKHSDYPIEDNTTILSVLMPTSTDEKSSVSVQTRINDYLASHNLIDENGLPLSSYQTNLASAIDGILADTDLIGRFTTEILEERHIAQMEPTREGWLSPNIRGLAFYSNGIGTESDFDYLYADKFSDMNWHVDNNSLALTLADDIKLMNVGDVQAELYGKFSYDTLNLLHDFINQHSVIQLYKSVKEKQRIQLIHDTGSSFKVVIESEITEEVSFGHEYYDELWSGEPLVYQAPTTKHYSTFQYDFPSLWLNKTLEDLQGSWLLPLVYYSELYWSDDELMDASDRVSISGNIANGALSGYQFLATLDNGVLSLVDGDIEFRVLPFKLSGKAMLAQVQYLKSGVLTAFYYYPIAQFDASYTALTDINLTHGMEIIYWYKMCLAINFQWEEKQRPLLLNILRMTTSRRLVQLGQWMRIRLN